MIPTLKTPRRCLRAWREADLPQFAALNADARVMELMPSLLSRDESDAMAVRIGEHFDRHEFGQWAVEVAGGAEFIGFVGLKIPQFTAPFTPCVEIGWRLAHEHWGQGYATEAAQAVLAFAFTHLRLDEIVSFTVPANARSRRVMERLGMSCSPSDDFDFPTLAEGHPLRRHVLYRLSRDDWEREAAR
jgi:RimJ/RimL family protein N-acetyltransferase